MKAPRFIPKCYDWADREIPFSVMQGRYGFRYHEKIDHLPIGANKAWYPVQIREAHGKAYFVATASGAAIRMEVPPTGYTEQDGHVVHSMTTGDYTYYPGQHGLIGHKVIDRFPSCYVDGIGILYGGHRPDELPPADQGNNYLHPDFIWGLVDIERVGDVPFPPVIAPPIAPNTVTIPRALAEEIKRHAAASADLDAEITKWLNQRPG